MPYVTSLSKENIYNVLNYKNRLKKINGKDKDSATNKDFLKILLNDNFSNRDIKIDITFESC